MKLPKRVRLILVLSTFGTLAAIPISVLAEEAPTPKKIRTIIASFHDLDGKEYKDWKASQTLPALKFFCRIEQTEGVAGDDAVELDNLAALQKLSGSATYQLCEKSRFISHKYDVVRVYFVGVKNKQSDGCDVKLLPLLPKETPRLSAIQAQLKSIFKYVSGVVAADADPPVLCARRWGDITLGEPIADLAVEATTPIANPKQDEKADEKVAETTKSSDARAATGGADERDKSDSTSMADNNKNEAVVADEKKKVDESSGADDKKVAEKPTFNMTTGGEEHVFISADVISHGAKQLKFDSATNSVTEKNKPSQIYLGFNYMFGDLYSPVDRVSWKRVVVKGLVSASKSPFDSYGVGLGYRFSEAILDSSNKSNSGFVIFVGSFWTKGDESTQNVDGGRKQSWRLGISYSLGTAMDWLK